MYASLVHARMHARAQTHTHTTSMHTQGVSVSKSARLTTIFSTSKDHFKGDNTATCGCVLVSNNTILPIVRAAAAEPLARSISIYLSIYLSVCLSVCLSVYLSAYRSIYLSVYLWSDSPSVCRFWCTCLTHRAIYLSVCLSIHLSMVG